MIYCSILYATQLSISRGKHSIDSFFLLHCFLVQKRVGKAVVSWDVTFELFFDMSVGSNITRRKPCIKSTNTSDLVLEYSCLWGSV